MLQKPFEITWKTYFLQHEEYYNHTTLKFNKNEKFHETVGL